MSVTSDVHSDRACRIVGWCVVDPRTRRIITLAVLAVTVGAAVLAALISG